MIYDSGLLQKIYINIANGTFELSKKQIESYRKEQEKQPDTFPYDKLPQFWGLCNMNISDFPGELGHHFF